MFSNEDVREIYRLFPPPLSSSSQLPSLILASSGQGLITNKSLKADFEQIVSGASERIAISAISEQLHVDRSTVVQLARHNSHLTLISSDSNYLAPKSERDQIGRQVQETLSTEFLSKQDFASERDIDTTSLDALLANTPNLISHDGFICTSELEHDLSVYIKGLIESTINNNTHTWFTLKDCQQAPGKPPLWLVLWHYKHIIKSQNLEDEVFLRESPNRIECQSRKLKASNVKVYARALLLGEEAQLDLRLPLKQSSEVYDSLDDVKAAFGKEDGLEIVDSYALSERWSQEFVKKSLQDLHYQGRINVPAQLEKFFPESILQHAVSRVEKSILAAPAEKPELQLSLRHVGGFILTDAQYEKEKEALILVAKDQGIFQWEQRKTNHDLQLKFNLSVEKEKESDTNIIQRALLEERAIEKAVDEAFEASILSHEGENEAEFASFWTERVITRVQLYNTGLGTIEDEKLKTQLAELLATCIRKELVPDTITKARSQGLLLSRRTQKNMQKLEAKIQAASSVVTTLLSDIEKFNKKQGIDDPAESLAEESKKSMVSDMLRRMQRQQKASDGPVLFLTLVILLFAKHNAGVVYATGKFAPKLLKQLKSKLSSEEYDRIEKWKGVAKLGALSEQDRECMRMMASTR